MKPAKVAKVVNFDCGCLCEYVYYGDQSHYPDSEGIPQKLDWHVVPCTAHAASRQPGDLEQRAERTYSVLVNRVEREPLFIGEAELSYK